MRKREERGDSLDSLLFNLAQTLHGISEGPVHARRQRGRMTENEWREQVVVATHTQRELKIYDLVRERRRERERAGSCRVSSCFARRDAI